MPARTADTFSRFEARNAVPKGNALSPILPREQAKPAANANSPSASDGNGASFSGTVLFRTTSAICPTAFFTEADAVLAAEKIDERIICAVILLSLRCGFTSGFTFSFPLLRLGTTFHHSLRSLYQPQGVKYVGKVCIFALFYKKVTVMKKNRCIII